MTRFGMVGAGGRMGRAIIALAYNTSFGPSADLQLTAAVEGEGSPFLGSDAGELAGVTKLGVEVVADLKSALADTQVVIDFSAPSNTVSTARACADAGVAYVSGTTGLPSDAMEELKEVATRIPVLHAPNMSVGVNVLQHVLATAAKALGSAYDIEIIEAHHKHKKDAPSGTALRLKDVILEALDKSESDVIYGRHGAEALRRTGEIAVHTLRGGDTVGDHTVFFFGEGERIEISHRASSRNTFAAGALRAAQELAGAKPGMYSMREVLGL